MGSVLVHPQLAVGRGRGLGDFTDGLLEEHKGSLPSVAMIVFGIFVALKSAAWGVRGTSGP